MQLTENVEDCTDLRSGGSSDAILHGMGRREQMLGNLIGTAGDSAGSGFLDVGCGPGILSMASDRGGASGSNGLASGSEIIAAKEA